MPAYHSEYHDFEGNWPTLYKQVSGIYLLPFKSKALVHLGPMDDIIDETFQLFRANCFFRNFELKRTADRLLIYATLFLSDALGKIKASMSYGEAQKMLFGLALGNLSASGASSLALPGDAAFPLNALYPSPGSRAEADLLRAYLVHLRQEICARLLEKLYGSATAPADRPSKWWLCFQKRKFMNKSL